MARNLLLYSKQMMRQEFTAKRLQNSAQGFNPGSDVPKKCAPKVAPESNLQTVGVADRLTNASYGFWRPCEAHDNRPRARFSAARSDGVVDWALFEVDPRREVEGFSGRPQPRARVQFGQSAEHLYSNTPVPQRHYSSTRTMLMRPFRTLHRTMPDPGLKPWAESATASR
jgi:hypothetical protein